MADVVMLYIGSKLANELVRVYTNHLAGADEAVRWIDYEIETLLPHVERLEFAGQGQNVEVFEKFRDVIRRAEDLGGTYTKMMIQKDAATFKAFYQLNIWKTTIQLHRVKKEITDWRIDLLKPNQVCSLSGPGPAPETQTVPYYLRRLARYLLLFPPNEQVPARRLIVLWVAEGLVHPKKHDDKSAEQIARGYLKELMQLRVINGNDNGRLTCSIDQERRKELMKEAKKDEFLEDKKGGIHRLVDHNGSSDGGNSFINIQRKFTTSMSLKNYRKVISFLSFNTREGSKPGEDIGDFLQKCISAGCFLSLRVLDLERVFRPKLPDTLGRLITMKYLGLRGTYLEQLPNSVEKLFNLQVLDVKHTYISVLPRSIWRMQFLTHLYLSEAYRTRFPHPPSKVTLTALQTLWGAFVDEDTPVQGGLDTLSNIRKLGLSCRSTASKSEEAVVTMVEQLKAIDKWISKLEFLESLRLKSRDEDNKADYLRLTSLKGNRKLSKVYLLGKLDSILLCTLPASLTNITLSGSNLQLDPLEFLGSLPNLTILRLLGHSVGSSQMYCSERAFPRLKLLWIWKLEKLKDFQVEEGSLPYLEELEIRECPDLEALPSQLGSCQMSCSKRSFPKLKILRISKMEKLKDFHVEEGSLPCLEELEIRVCQNLEALLGPLGSIQMYCSKRAFPELKILRISKLEKLKGFHVEEGSLPCLEELEIRDCQNLEALPRQLGSSQMYCSERAFPHLKVLRILKREKLKDLQVEDGSLPYLEELEIGDCQNMEALPRPLLHIPELKIKLTDMSDKIGKEARSINPNVNIIEQKLALE